MKGGGRASRGKSCDGKSCDGESCAEIGRELGRKSGKELGRNEIVSGEMISFIGGFGPNHPNHWSDDIPA
jgi:hypothetical protein